MSRLSVYLQSVPLLVSQIFDLFTRYIASSHLRGKFPGEYFCHLQDRSLTQTLDITIT